MGGVGHEKQRLSHNRRVESVGLAAKNLGRIRGTVEHVKGVIRALNVAWLRSKIRFALLILGITRAASSISEAAPQPIVSYLSTGYHLLVVPQGGGPSGFEQPGFDDSQLSVGYAAFGSGGFCPLDSTVKTSWPINTDILLRKSFTLPSDVTALEVAVAIDNDVRVFFNPNSEVEPVD
jgi:hypothetical protein